VIACLLVTATIAPTALAHPADKVVQAAYLTLAPGGLRLELDLTSGELVANQFLGFLDQNTDGQIGDDEISVFAERVIQDLSVRFNGQVAALHLESKTVPDPAGLRTGEQQVTLIFAANLPNVTGENNLEFRNTLEFLNNFAPIRNAHLANVFVQSGEVTILDQKRDANQQDFWVRYGLHGLVRDRRQHRAFATSDRLAADSSVAFRVAVLVWPVVWHVCDARGNQFAGDRRDVRDRIVLRG
jgi:hypothetical protein